MNPEQPQNQPPPPPPPAPPAYGAPPPYEAPAYPPPSGGQPYGQQPYGQQPYGYPPALPRKGLPTWAWILGGCGCLFFGVSILAAILFPVFSQARMSARRTSCLSNIKQLNLGILMYTTDYDDRMPPAATWMDKGEAYVKLDSAFHCPEVSHDGDSVYGYAFNGAVDRKSMEKFTVPQAIPMIYDSKSLGRNASDLQTSLPFPGRHAHRNSIGFVDGHASPIPDSAGFGSNGF